MPRGFWGFGRGMGYGRGLGYGWPGAGRGNPYPFCRVAKTLGLQMGVVINRDGVGDRGVEDYSKEKGLPILLRIPLDRRIAVAYSRGVPFILELPEWQERFREMFTKISELATREGVR